MTEQSLNFRKTKETTQTSIKEHNQHISPEYEQVSKWLFRKKKTELVIDNLIFRMVVLSIKF